MDNQVVTIVAGGWSAGQVDLARLPGQVIAINDAAMYLPRGADVIVSMDRHWTEQRWSWLSQQQRPFWARDAALKRITERPDWLRIFKNDNTTNEFSDVSGVLNGMNSGACGFNYAYQLQPRTIYLLGFDFRPGPKGESHWFPTYSWAVGKVKVKTVWADLDVCARQCKAAGIEVFVVGDWSTIRAFPRVPYSELNRRWGASEGEKGGAEREP